MKRNIGRIDRFIRFLLSAVFAGLFLCGTCSGVLGYILALRATIFFLTALGSFSPLYHVLGWSTVLNRNTEEYAA
jgi:hypothetical protein